MKTVSEAMSDETTAMMVGLIAFLLMALAMWRIIVD